jgi:DNA-directed RNA polymerase specialized sigma24 family protein
VIALPNVPNREVAMSSEGGSVSGWIGRLQAGDGSAAQRLWERYFRRLVGLARVRLRGAGSRGTDGEDVALSAFASLCRGAQHGRFPQLADRDGLWRLLVVLTARKAGHVRRDERRLRRGGGRSDVPVTEPVLDEVLGLEPTPAFAAEVAEAFERLLGRLTEELRAIALRKLDGYTTEEIVGQLGCARRTVERRLRLIRHLWAAEDGP